MADAMNTLIELDRLALLPRDLCTASLFVFGVVWAADAKRWIWMGVFTAIALLMREDVPIGLSIIGLFLLALYCIPTNSILPLPHEPGVLYFSAYYDPIAIAIAATLGSLVVSFADYAMVEAAMRRPRLNAASKTGLFGWAVRWMKRAPFAIVVLFSFTPLPISVIRVLAPASNYPLGRYMVAQVIGRLPRFYALAWLGRTVKFPAWVLLAMFVVLMLVFWWSSRTPRGGAEALPTEVAPEPSRV